MPVIPYHKYLGPGNELSAGEPVDTDDLIALEHDRAYHSAKKQSDISNSDLHAINDFVGDFQSGNLHSAVGALGLGIKYGAEKLLGPLYGMSKGKRSHEEPDSSQPEAGPSKVKILQDTQIRPPFPFSGQLGAIYNQNRESEENQADSSMDIPSSLDASGILNEGNGPSRAGSGPGMGAIGAGGLASPSIFDLQKTEGTPFRTHFRKSYRWMTTSSTSKYQWQFPNFPLEGNTGEIIEGLGHVAWKIGSTASFDMSKAMWYVDLREYNFLRSQCNKVMSKSASLNIHALGARLPYKTGSTVIEVANSNCQIPVMDLSEISRYYQTVAMTDTDQTDIFNKIMGEKYGQAYSTIRTTPDWVENFPNISARMETRLYNHRALVKAPVAMSRTFNDPPTTFTDTFADRWGPSDINLIQHARKVINASNHLGLAFQKKFDINQPFTNMIDPGYNDKSPLYGRSTDTTQATFSVKTDILSEPKLAERFVIAQPELQPVRLFKQTIFGGRKIGENAPNNEIFILGIYNIRNVDIDPSDEVPVEVQNKVLNINFEYITEFCWEVIGNFVNPLYHSLNFNRATPFWNERFEYTHADKSGEILVHANNAFTAPGRRVGFQVVQPDEITQEEDVQTVT